jgi:cation:H+ antiporter
MMSGSRMTRVEGGLFVAVYVAYLSWLLATRT